MRVSLNDVMLIPASHYLLSSDNVFLDSYILLVQSPVILGTSGEFKALHFFFYKPRKIPASVLTVGEHRAIFNIAM